MKGLQMTIVAIVIIAVVAGAGLLVVGRYGTSTGENQTPAGANSVNIQNLAFSPSSITVSAGTTVTWTNNDSVTHTVTSTGGPVSFSSGEIPAGQTWQHTFDNAGTYTYMCSIHTYMTGTVVVQ